MVAVVVGETTTTHSNSTSIMYIAPPDVVAVLFVKVQLFSHELIVY